MAPKTKALPERTLEQVVEHFPFHRQSLLADADTCMLASKWRLESAEAIDPALRMDRMWDRADAARGVLAHRYCAEVLGTLWRTGNTEMPVAEALETLYEVCAQRDVSDADVVYLPARERRYLRMFAIRVVQKKDKTLRTWNMAKMDAIEERLWAKVTYDSPLGGTVDRVITGQPDLLLLDPPDGVVVLDWKTTPKAPAAPKIEKMRGPDFPGDDVPNNVSYEGYFQQRVYALLILANRPEVDRVTLREVYPMDPDGLQVRKATVYRSDLERITRELGVVTELLDRAIAGGSGSLLWKPQPGKHCSYCPRPGSCPIDRQERQEGAITSMAQAEQYAAGFLIADAVRTHRREALKAWHDQTGHAIPVKYAKGRAELRYETGTKRFGMYVPDDSDRGPEDASLVGVFKAAAERKRAA